MRISDWSSDVCSADLILEGQAGGPVLLEQLQDASRRRPLRSEARQHARDLRAVDAVGPLVGAGSGGVLDTRPRNASLDNLSNLPDTVVLGGPLDIEARVVDQVSRRLGRNSVACGKEGHVGLSSVGGL